MKQKFNIGDYIVNVGSYGFLIGRLDHYDKYYGELDLCFKKMYHKDGTPWRGEEGMPVRIMEKDGRLATQKEIDEIKPFLPLKEDMHYD